jgi:hypothetical protein
MAKINGGIIGPNNPTGPFSAGGVWRLEDAFNAQKAGTWPLVLGYQIPNSLRFNAGSTDYLSKNSWATATSDKIFTYSTWVKRSQLGSTERLFGAFAGSPQVYSCDLSFTSNNGYIEFTFGGASAYDIVTNAMFRDISAWYHVVLAVDTTQATDTNRIKIYVNNTLQTLQTANYPPQNTTYQVFRNNNANLIGSAWNGGAYYTGYMSETYFIDGQQLTPSSFGQTDSATGIWKPIPYTGSFGTNGFYLEFKDSSALGDDTSGNGNDFTANNLTSIDQSYDSPTNNFATFNPLIRSYASQSYTLTEGNLQATDSSTGGGFGLSTIATTSGKWYWEGKVTAVAKLFGIGWTTLSNIAFGYHGCYLSNGTVVDAGGNTATTFATYTTNDIIGVAVDISAGKVWFSKNGTFLGSGNPVAGTSPAFTFTGSLESAATFCIDNSAGTSGVACNFGYPPFTISSGNADANGFGNFEYAVPSGYYALCTKNLALYG